MSRPVKCPKCGTDVEIDEALSATIEEELRGKYQGEMESLRETFDKERDDLTKKMEDAVRGARQEATDLATKNAVEAVSGRMADLQFQVDENSRALDEARKAEAIALRQSREAAERARDAEVILERRLLEETSRLEEKYRSEARTQVMEAVTRASEENRLRDMEKEHLIAEMKGQIEELKRKAEQGSMQLQGEVLELEIEKILSAAFIHDQVKEVPKGIRGPDCILEVSDPRSGVTAGKIIFEAKRTKAWSRDWPSKLREDQRATHSDVAVIITQIMPAGANGPIHFIDGVWVCNFQSTIGLATVLRSGILQVAQAKTSMEGRHEKTEMIYAYLTGPQFRNAVTAVVGSLHTQKLQLDRERRAMEKLWAIRDKEIDKGAAAIASIFGSIQGIVGGTEIPEIKDLELENGEDSPIGKLTP